MNKLLTSVGLAIGIATASMLAGCQLYFGDHHDRGSDGTSSPGGGSGDPSGPAPGSVCNGDAQCAAGCFCADGTCTEGGFCKSDTDCGDGFTCDTTRASCIPAPGCTANEQCDPGSVCDTTTGKGCVVTCKCASDAEAVAQGAGWCDEARSTCMTGTDPAGACTGDLTCTTAGPKCNEGEVPLLKDGCYTGACRAITSCEAAPVCKALQYENDCIARNTDCSTVYNGHGCTKPDGSACHVGDANCTCTSFTYAGCQDKGANLTVVIPE